MRCTIVGILLTSMMFWAGQTNGQDLIQPLPGKSLKGARGVDVVAAEVQNDQAAFSVRVAVDRKDRIYEKGEVMKVTVRSDRTGFLYLLYKQADGSTKCLFPNLYESDNKIRGGKTITLPTPRQGFRLRCSDPLGEELLVAIVTQGPVAVEQLGVKSLTKSIVTDVNLRQFVRGIRSGKGMTPEGTGDKPGRWAENSVPIKTVEAGSRGGQAQSHQRIGLFIGISKYSDSRIRDLHICHRDATVMSISMKKYGRLDGACILLDEDATRANIERAFAELKSKSNPGDEIFIYWSGHGASCADTGGDEADGRDEYLVPYDGRESDPTDTMILDDALGRWVQTLDGCKVTLILDACHSAGQAHLKGLGGPTPADFLDNEFSRIKDIGQDDASMLFSSASDEISAERRDGKLSVMTYFLVEKLRASNSLTLQQAYDHVRSEVPSYMRVHFPGRKQTPQLCPEGAGDDVRLR